MPIGEVAAAYERAANDPGFAERLQVEPEVVGREMGLRGGDLAELVGSERMRAAGQERSRRFAPVLEDIVHHNLGRAWSFVGLSNAELGQRAALAEAYGRRLYVAKGMGHERTEHSRPSLEELVQWGTALEDEIRTRADTSGAVDTVLADGLVRTMGLISSARRIAAGDPR